jgi:hypothetical protein
MPRDEKYACPQCGDLKGPTYMAKNALYEQTAKGDRFLCWKCFEARLGRPLQPSDMRPCPATLDFLWEFKRGSLSPDAQTILQLGRGTAEQLLETTQVMGRTIKKLRARGKYPTRYPGHMDKVDREGGKTP